MRRKPRSVPIAHPPWFSCVMMMTWPLSDNKCCGRKSDATVNGVRPFGSDQWIVQLDAKPILGRHLLDHTEPQQRADQAGKQAEASILHRAEPTDANNRTKLAKLGTG